MASRRDAKSSPQPESRPPYYIATAPLFIGGQFGRAHNVGDRVPVEHVDRYGWHEGVRPPDGYETPAPVSPQPRTEPETDQGQATSKEGEA